MNSIWNLFFVFNLTRLMRIFLPISLRFSYEKICVNLQRSIDKWNVCFHRIWNLLLFISRIITLIWRKIDTMDGISISAAWDKVEAMVQGTIRLLPNLVLGLIVFVFFWFLDTQQTVKSNTKNLSKHTNKFYRHVLVSVWED